MSHRCTMALGVSPAVSRARVHHFSWLGQRWMSRAACQHTAVSALSVKNGHTHSQGAWTALEGSQLAVSLVMLSLSLLVKKQQQQPTGGAP